MVSVNELNALSAQARGIIIDIAASEVGCHLGGALSVIDILIYTLNNYLADQNNCVVLSKGHAAAALYSAMYVLGYSDTNPADEYGQCHSLYTGHPNHKIPHIRFSTGSLGHGVGYAAGWALAQRQAGSNGTAIVIGGDGELQEGLCWEVLQVLSAQKITDFIYIIDRNGAQNDGYVNDISPMVDLKERFASYHMDVVEIDGHDFEQLAKALSSRRNRGLVIIANTVKGKGIPQIEGNPSCHYVKIKRHQAIKWKMELDHAFR
ncbi:transketolase [Prodigiosinella confusarubida]|uniref:Transketolase n=1 Tax=Serratia sp. (strain ATCC 39006) TaxID=104623 RepID=A0A2I5T5Y5_SERS3|nr:1-deoxy-D-xylulose-5-phosphate synthase N-terminal domain-containing protein [Serratia sp. ATCC 39006]AUG99982.1 transketolase [Serratia sp. ATCC 39006]AUH04302.1 transketolase [Serratia sp. ATCC 39006]